MMPDVKILLALEKHLDEVVQRARECVKKTNAAQTDTQDTQFRNLHNMAVATESILALENFIGYQIGRKYLDANVGRQILQDIEELHRSADEICNELHVINEVQKRRALMELIRLYLGFLIREIIAERKGRD